MKNALYLNKVFKFNHIELLGIMLVWMSMLQYLHCQQCFNSVNNFKSPIKPSTFTLIPEFKDVSSVTITKINEGQLLVLGEFGQFQYEGTIFKSISIKYS